MTVHGSSEEECNRNKVNFGSFVNRSWSLELAQERRSKLRGAGEQVVLRSRRLHAASEETQTRVKLDLPKLGRAGSYKDVPSQ